MIVCVFCGSSSGHGTAYLEAAWETGRAIAQRGWGLVYGGAHVGLMGAVADAALQAGGEVIGVLPQGLERRELAHPRLTALHIVSSMHERKALMARLSTAFIALPGGFGTLDELFEILTWAQLELHNKPCSILNVNGFFDSLLEYLDGAVRAGFLRPAHRHRLIVETAIPPLLDGLLTPPPAPVNKW